MLIGQFINMTTGSVNVLLMMTNNENIVRLNTSISAIMCLLLGIIFIPKFGIMAAAIVTSLAIAFQNILNVFFVFKRLRFNPLFFSSS